MIQSMTGFGKSEFVFNQKKVTIDIRSVNSKQLDLSIKIPAIYRDRESDLRSRIMSRLNRGKVDVYVTTESTGTAETALSFNEEVIGKYFGQLKDICLSQGIKASDGELLAQVMRLSDTVSADGKPEQSEEELELFDRHFDLALQAVEAFRRQEGAALQADLRQRIGFILSFLDEVGPFEAQRIEACRARLKEGLEKEVGAYAVDRNRFEQEIIYYLEKLDITEEKVRLRNHCRYFTDTMDAPAETGTGKKLGFIIQEIGREINTLGSKANEMHIQEIVVRMKDELEKIREQSMNIL